MIFLAWWSTTVDRIDLYYIMFAARSCTYFSVTYVYRSYIYKLFFIVLIRVMHSPL